MGGASHTLKECVCLCVFRQECIDSSERCVAVVLGSGWGLVVGGRGYQ